MQGKPYLRGLTSIRFFLAALVVLAHCRGDLLHYDIVVGKGSPVFSKGELAVAYFFVLSGFLLTYLAYSEFIKNNRIDIKKFFIRRILRIFPLYYLGVFLGYFTLGFLYPKFYGEPYLAFSISEGFPFHLFSLPNWVIAKYSEGVGSLYSLWSLGVEEQFYLFFPFLCLLLFKLKNSTTYLAFLAIAYYAMYTNLNNLYPTYWPESVMKFLITLKFHFMLTGGVFGLLYFRRRTLFERLFTSKLSQIIVLLLFLGTVFTSNVLSENDLLYGSIFSLFLISLTCNTTLGNVFEHPILKHLGVLSFGVYVFHPLVSYSLRFVLEKSDAALSLVSTVPATYIVTEILLAILVAHLSYRYFEKRFLDLKIKYST